MAMSTHLLATLSNPLVTVEQLSTSSSQLDSIPADLESSIQYNGALMTQAAGVLLRLPQEIVSQAIVTFNRFYVGPEGGSFRLHSVKDVSAASLYLTAKLSFLPQSPRSVLNVYAYLLSDKSSFLSPSADKADAKVDPESYYLSEGLYQSLRNILLSTESLILRSLSFTTHVSIPHHLALTYLQTLGALPSATTSTSTALARRTLAHLNTALLSPQLLYLTHQPPALAVAAIYLAAKEVGVKLVRTEWWEVFDVEREELGFLVVAMGSMVGWAEKEKQKWGERRCPLTTEEVEMELERSKI
ncbi:hypothetical protein MMC30_001895 [Trapelia coarctata]|nr:hypothetical protein [Trapelia coarctata]